MRTSEVEMASQSNGSWGSRALADGAGNGINGVPREGISTKEKTAAGWGWVQNKGKGREDILVSGDQLERSGPVGKGNIMKGFIKSRTWY